MLSATWVIAVAAVATAVVVWIQLRGQLKQMKYDSLTRLHQELLAEDMQDALRLVYALDPSVIVRDTDPLHFQMAVDHLASIESVLNAYDLIGYRVTQGVLPRRAVLDTESMVLLRIWKQLQLFVEAERLRRKDPRYKEHLQSLVTLAEGHRNTKAGAVTHFGRI